MRFMLMIKGDPRPDQIPPAEMFEAMARYNEQLVEAGALLAAEGLLPSHAATRVTHNADGITVTDGPFAESKELVAGFWIIQAASREEAVEWARRVPFESDTEYGDERVVEIRQIGELEDFDTAPEHVKRREAELRALAGGA
jgi:hypothetical protein